LTLDSGGKWSVSFIVEWLVHHLVLGWVVEVLRSLWGVGLRDDCLRYDWLVGEVLLADKVHDALQVLLILTDALLQESEGALDKVHLVYYLVKCLFHLRFEHLVGRPDCGLAEHLLFGLLWCAKWGLAAI
jgi:hypothetical protein